MKDDLISRQAAIEHLKKRLYETALNNVTEHPYYEEMADNRVSVWLKEVPSAQPEIIRCKDCKYFDPLTEDFDYNFCDAWAGGTNEDMFCGFAERRQDADSSGNMSGTQKALKCTETHSCDYQRTETHESCTDCPLYDHERHNCPRFNKVIPRTIRDAQQRWIPVTEALPKNGHYYLKCTKYGNVDVDYYWDGFENATKYGEEIVAWMEKPKPYKG